MAIEDGRTRSREDGFLKRLWRRFQDFSADMEVTEASLLAERVEQVERHLRELDRKEKAKS